MKNYLLKYPNFKQPFSKLAGTNNCDGVSSPLPQTEKVGTYFAYGPAKLAVCIQACFGHQSHITFFF